MTVCPHLFDTVPLNKKPGDLLVEPVLGAAAQREAARDQLSEAERAAKVREKRAADRELGNRLGPEYAQHIEYPRNTGFTSAGELQIRVSDTIVRAGGGG